MTSRRNWVNKCRFLQQLLLRCHFGLPSTDRPALHCNNESTSVVLLFKAVFSHLLLFLIHPNSARLNVNINTLRTFRSSMRPQFIPHPIAMIPHDHHQLLCVYSTVDCSTTVIYSALAFCPSIGASSPDCAHRILEL